MGDQPPRIREMISRGFWALMGAEPRGLKNYLSPHIQIPDHASVHVVSDFIYFLGHPVQSTHFVIRLG